MTIAEKIFEIWSGDPTATALVPAARFKPPGNYQNITVPYVIFHPIIQQRYRTMREGAADALEYGTWQFSIFAASFTAAEAISDKLINLYDRSESGNHDGFNFQYKDSRFVDETPDRTMVLVATDFLITSVP